MAIYGVQGGIGTGKTLTVVYLGLSDLRAGKRLYTNISLKGLSPDERRRVTYLTKDTIKSMFERVKAKELDLRNSTIMIQEMHNYLDSRNSMSPANRTLSYWILQSRHTGEGSCDIIFDTQEMRQVDVRLRNNVDYLILPQIVEYYMKGTHKVPVTIRLNITAKIKHKVQKMTTVLGVSDTIGRYDTHEIVEF